MLLGSLEKEREDGFQDSLLLLLRCEGERRIAAVRHGHREKRGEQRHGLRQRKSIVTKLDLELFELGLDRILRMPPEHTVQEVDDRIERAVLVIGRAATLPIQMRLSRQPLLEHEDQARFPDASL